MTPRRFILWCAVAVLSVTLFMLAMGCAPLPASLPARKPLPKVLTLVWSKDFNRSAVAAWEAQIVSRWPNERIAVVACHGLDDARPWLLSPDRPRRKPQAETVADVLRAILPDYKIVFLSCNPTHDRLKTPNVAYSLNNVWIHPGPDRRWHFAEDDCDQSRWVRCDGNISEFVVTK